jgi:two-component system, NtrC family, sensor kinase
VDNSQTLLIVDDEPNVLKSVRRLLIDTDYKVLSADSGESALELFNTDKIQLVISDYRMPGMNGVEFLNKVREKHPDTIRIILSGYADAAAMLDAINDGQVYRFITKPWNDQELLTSIIRAFEQYKLKEENAKLYAEVQSRNAELQDLTKTLEEKVATRTRDLEMNNRALQVAQNILNMLPAGVLGIDSDETVVYMNANLKNFIDINKVCLGLPASGAVDDIIISSLRKSMDSGQTAFAVVNKEKELGIICTPLPQSEGAIGLFALLNIEKYFPTSVSEA